MSDANNRRHPETTFKADYPYNQATITRSGHEIHINDTPDNESLRIAHTKGSYVELDKDGRTVVNSVGKAYYYMCDGFTTTVDGHNDLKVRGSMNINVDESVNEQVGKNKYTSYGGSLLVGVGENLTQTVVSDKFESIGGNETSYVDKSEYRGIGGDSVTQISGVKSEILEKDWSVSSGGNIEFVGSGHKSEDLQKDWTVTAGDNIVFVVGGHKFESIQGDWSVAAENAVIKADDTMKITTGTFHIVCNHYIMEAQTSTTIFDGGTF